MRISPLPQVYFRHELFSCQQELVNYYIHSIGYNKFSSVCGLDFFTLFLSLSIILILFQKLFWSVMFLSFFIFCIAEDKSLRPSSTIRKSQLPQMYFRHELFSCQQELEHSKKIFDLLCSYNSFF